MKKRFLICAAVCALALAGAMALAGCSTSVGITFSDDAVSGSIEAESNNLTVKLDGNPTTGFEWTAESDSDALKLVGTDWTSSNESSSSSDDDDDELVGVGGTYTFQFEGSAADTTTLSFEYARTWETAEAVHVTVEVTTDDSGNISDLKVMDGDTVLGETK